MAIIKYIFLFFFAWDHFSTLLLLRVHGQLLPIIDEVGGIDPTKTPVYIVHVARPRGVRFRRFRDLKNWYMSFLPNATLGTGEPRLIYAYREVISGFAARMTSEEAEAMEEMEGFVAAYPEQEHEALTTYTPSFLRLTGQGSGSLWYDSAMGAGQIIGVIDTGINPYHQSFSDDGMPQPPTKWKGKCYWGNTRICNNKLLGAVGFRYKAYSNPEDNDGHGTHVASTAAGNFVSNANVIGQAPGTASGIAPRAHLAIYKVLFKGPSGHSVGTDADILAGIEQAIRDQVDILQMSLGSAKMPLFDCPVCIGSFSAVTKGIFPCAAAANDGPTPSILANDAPWIMTVGASTIDRKILATVKLGNGSELAGESANQAAPPPTGQLPLAFPGSDVPFNTDALGCQLTAIQQLNLRGKIVVCYRFDIEDRERGFNVLRTGGAAMIMINHWKAGETTSAFANVLPAAHINNTGSQVLDDYYHDSPNPTAAIEFGGTKYGVMPAPAVAVFSSRGPSLTNGGIIKPDVIAPGVNILAAWPRPVGPTGSHYNFLSGTSMATPHVSGIVALLRNKHPTWSPAAIKSAIMTTAYTVNMEGNPITDEYRGKAATVFARGAGHVDPEAAADPGLIYELNYWDYVHYLCGYYNDDNKVSRIVQGSMSCSQVRSISPEQLNYPSFSVNLGAGTTEVTVARRVINVGDANSEYTVQVDEPQGVRVDVNPSTLRFSQVGEELSYSVTFKLKGGAAPAAGVVVDGQLRWDSGKNLVSSPIAVSFS
ncbi:Subtilisin-like protease SDD1 [Apostasia shenzhenica]|uniref:Subtilisin-like protease SDD1 n=1 Tax=Apostasia shenzhenica TaxID=1088818 RepID=A0A2I0BAY1_9ASPA|nr:Subtilisin-like protease SDD1 [Apostasia shenzhenica]